MKVRILILGLISLLIVFGCSSLKREYSQSIRVKVENSSTLNRQDEAINLSIKALKEKDADFNAKAFVVLCDDKELASQAIDLDGDQVADQIVIVTNMSANTSKTLDVRYQEEGEVLRSYPKRTQAELSVRVGGKWVDRKYEGGTFKNVSYLRVPPEHTDHSLYIRYEGPGWESDKVGYRFYLDWRNAIDIFGKKTPAMVLQNVGQDGFESYHEMSDWGQDILKVGETLGMGSIGMWVDDHAQRVEVTDSITCEIVSNGPVQSRIQTVYYGWSIGFAKYNLTSDLSICAGSRLTRHDLLIEGNPPNMCTGLVKTDTVEVMKIMGQNWQALASWGKQSLANDNLGMAVLFRNQDLIEITEDSDDDVVVLSPTKGELTYYFLAAWDKEPNGITTKEGFIEYLKNTLQLLDTPVKVTYE